MFIGQIINTRGFSGFHNTAEGASKRPIRKESLGNNTTTVGKSQVVTNIVINYCHRNCVMQKKIDIEKY